MWLNAIFSGVTSDLSSLVQLKFVDLFLDVFLDLLSNSA